MLLNRVVALATLTVLHRGCVLALPNGELLGPRAECKPYKIVEGDSCSKIASDRCGNIKLDDLYKYNSGLKDKCNNLKYILVESGDYCYKIAKERCNIEPEQLYKFNGGGSDAFCSTIVPKQPLCCTKGKLPDLRPKKNADGTCFVHSVAKDEVCGSIAGANFLTVKELESFNVGKTWGFAGCSRLMPNQRICLSDGTPPVPAEIPGIDCGPQKPGTNLTKMPADGKIADLNPCPLNTCCNTWGFCGTTPEFCVDTTVDKTPGTAKNGTAGCISNCGLDIVNNKNPPKTFGKIGYFESWNPYSRGCLNMDVTDVPKSGGGYTHLHFAFGNITEDFQISMSGVQDQWDKFVKMQGIHKVVAFGGWAFSNEPSTNHIIRNGVKPGNRDKFAKNVADFIKNNNLDGVDFDWEYPGATDIEGSDPGSPEDGPNYYRFLSTLRGLLGTGKTISFAAPASYWYLKNFPVKQMAQVVDYIVYMTYDLHGQWDVGNKYAVEGCEAGNCLRSHVNKTETMYSLAMVTKAGVPANKIFVGVSSYGRSFKMADAKCRGPMCTFLGGRNKSQAKPGECTETAGYIADAEIRQIQAIANAGFSDADAYQSLYDSDSDSDIFIYNNDEWVAWMDTQTKQRRTDLYKPLGFAGTSDWAVDLQNDYSSSDYNDTDWDGALDLSITCNLDKTYGSLDDLDKDAQSMYPKCVAMKAVNVLSGMLKTSFDGYDDAASGYDGLYPTYEKYIKDTMNERLTQWMYDDKDGKKPGYTYYRCYAAPGALYPTRKDATDADCSNLPGKNGDDYTYWFERRDDQKKAWEDSLSAAGFDPDWLDLNSEFETTDGIDNCPITEGTTSCITTNLRYFGFPRRKDNVDIPNPKDVVDAARKNLTALEDEYSSMYIDIATDSWDGTLEDAMEILAVPVFMLRDAIQSMKDVKDMAKKINDQNKKDLILKIVEGILFLIPFAGGAAGAFGRAGAMIGRFMSALDAGGNAALSIYSMIDNPDMAPVAILGMLLGALGTPTGSTYRKLGKVKHDMTPDMKKSMGKSFAELNPKVESISGKMCKKTK
ncbi:hypothetical protein QBC47DRAFT_443416 [Echria macrotheca]|uniref:chitinase n=1 Tax=Echria macrotheca TaxID=438768 RepID=A0AAJ0BJ29_9PEZI|nr:hypothetical protein QBC47DRAFT_443416 [Echria macrotheca]